MQAQRKLSAIMFTDVVGSSTKMGHEESETLHLIKRDFSLMQQITTQYNGKVVKALGDGLLVCFDSAVDAVLCGYKIQQTLLQRARLVPSTKILQHRIGIHLGDVYVTDLDVLGDGVNIAARLQSLAESGGIAISEMVYNVIKGKLALNIKALGHRKLKNIREKVSVYLISVKATSKRDEEKGLREIETNIRKIYGGRYGIEGYKWLCLVEFIVLATLAATKRLGPITENLWAPAGHDTLYYFEGIFSSPYVRIIVFLLLFPIAFLASLCTSRIVKRDMEDYYVRNAAMFTICNVAFVTLVLLTSFLLTKIDPCTSLW